MKKTWSEHLRIPPDALALPLVLLLVALHHCCHHKRVPDMKCMDRGF